MSALHVGQPIAGLRSSGKGANRTILECFSLATAGEKVSFGRRGGRGRRQPPLGGVDACLGRFHRLQLGKGFGIVTTASSADHPTRRDFLFVATGAAAAVGAAATVWPLVSQMNPDASTIAAGGPIEGDLTPLAEGQGIKVVLRGAPRYIPPPPPQQRAPPPPQPAHPP